MRIRAYQHLSWTDNAIVDERLDDGLTARSVIRTEWFRQPVAAALVCTKRLIFGLMFEEKMDRSPVDIRQIAGKHQPADIAVFLQRGQNAGNRPEVVITIDDPLKLHSFGIVLLIRACGYKYPMQK